MNRSMIKQIGKDNVKKQWGELLLALVLVEVATTFAALITVGIGSFVVSGPLSFGLTYLYYRQTQGDQPGQMMLLEGFKKKFGESFLAGLFLEVVKIIPVIIGIISAFSSLISMINRFRYGMYGYYDYGGGFSFGSLLWSLLQIVLTVACIYVFYGLCMAMYILVREQDKTAVGALKKSWAMTKGQKGRLFVFDLSFIGWWILVVLTLGILAIWVSPYYNSAKTVMFNDIYDHSHVADNPDFSFRDEFNGFKDMAGNVKDKAGNMVNHSNDDAAPAAPVAPEPAAVETPAQPAAPQPAPGMKFCKHCGAQISESAVFCNKCGGQQ